MAGAVEAAHPVAPISALAALFSCGEQPRCVQTPSITMKLGLGRAMLVLGVLRLLGRLRPRIGEPRCTAFSDSIISLVRRRIQTGLPRHSITASSPGAMREMSASTGAPAALGALRRPHARDERDCGGHARGPANDRRGDHQIAPRLVHFWFFIHGDGVGWRSAKACDSSDAPAKSTISLLNDWIFKGNLLY